MTTRPESDQSDDALPGLDRVAGVLAQLPEAGRAELLDALVALRGLRERIAAWEAPLIAAARAAGVSWADLAPALGLSSRQAAERRYLRLQPSGGADPRTGEERVRDERDRRAGDRAVAAWARTNSGPLRRLAGQIGALEGLPAAAQERVEDVQDALGQDDASVLLEPLAAVGPQLPAELARQVRDVTDQLHEVRRDAHDRRTRVP